MYFNFFLLMILLAVQLRAFNGYPPDTWTGGHHGRTRLVRISEFHNARSDCRKLSISGTGTDMLATKRILIVGGVAGGASCAARLRRLDETAEIVVLDLWPYVSFANCGLPYYVG